jgi:hypothetical protein
MEDAGLICPVTDAFPKSIVKSWSAFSRAHAAPWFFPLPDLIS